jgi:hypothetical protein
MLKNKSILQISTLVWLIIYPLVTYLLTYLRNLQLVSMRRIFAEIENKERIILCTIWGPHSGGYREFYLLGCNAV